MQESFKYLNIRYQRPFIDRPAALSTISLSWLGRILNLGEGGLLCTKQANLHGIFCNATDRSTEYTVLTGIAVYTTNHLHQNFNILSTLPL
jgi:hypothetical protein